ncbi:hypothetical protein [Variovorax sp. GT1P44]|uniref:hypothetical protein n=1 Tax=Variovorax sp. GT1P44 TaxID=3443742 RepID=UPI003F46F33B
MGSVTKPKLPAKQRVIDELLEIAVLTAYLFITIAAVNLMKAAVLRDHGIDLGYWGVAIVKALLLAKFVMVGKALKVGEHNPESPLIWPTLRKAFSFAALLIVLTVIEEVVVGWIHRRSMGDSLADMFVTRLPEVLAGIFILVLVLIPYFAFQVLTEALGERRLIAMFLWDRHAGENRPPAKDRGP